MRELQGVAYFAVHVHRLHLRNGEIRTDELKNAYYKGVQ